MASSSSCQRMNHDTPWKNPARIILLDLSPPFENVTGQLICEALENVLCLSSNRAGLPNIPLLGIYALTTYPEIVLPLNQVKGNFVRIYKALQDLRNLLLENSNCKLYETVGQCLPLGMTEACRQFQRYIGTTPRASLSFNQLEIVVLTAQKGDFVQQSLKNLPNEVDLTCLKRILSMTIQRSVPEGPSSLDILDIHSSGNELTGLVDVLTLEHDQKAVQRFFYNWLSETLSETEHLHLILPPPTTADADLVIKCDVIEKMINPCQLPCHSRFTIESDANLRKHVFHTSNMRRLINKLKTIQTIHRSELCESFLFGIPLDVVPTVCWTIDWEELQQNENNFNALCDELLKKDHVLLLQMLDESYLDLDSALNRKSILASGYFLVFPSDRNLLLKSVVPEELFLPSNRQRSLTHTNLDSELRIQSSLSQLITCDHYNPLKHSSGLFEALKHSTLPKSALKKVWNINRSNVKRKNNQKSQMVRPIVSSPPKFQKIIQEPGRKHTATVWSNPLCNVVKKATKTTTSRQTDVKSISETSWRSGFVEH